MSSVSLELISNCPVLVEEEAPVFVRSLVAEMVTRSNVAISIPARSCRSVLQALYDEG
jgi:hypothetical protein